MTIPHLMNCPHADAGWCVECVAELGNDNWRQRDELEALRKDAERWRHCKAHGHPMTGPQCIAWTYDGRMVFGPTSEEAVDNAIAYRVPAVGAA